MNARASGAFYGGAAVTRQQFEAYIESRDSTSEFPGARGFGFIRRVPKADEAAFLAADQRVQTEVAHFLVKLKTADEAAKTRISVRN